MNNTRKNYLDDSLKNQLKEVFSQLTQKVNLVYDESPHPSQEELLDMLYDVASSSPHLQALSSKQFSPIPNFRIFLDQGPSGVLFKGTPGGHEFTSLIVAILNSGGKGRLPDEALQRRIQKLKGPIHIKTYVSLTCENCPDVVQSLNQMALIHPQFTHETIDGSLVPDEIASLGVQGVPSCFNKNQLIHSGKVSFIDLLLKMEQHFGSNQGNSSEREDSNQVGDFDVVVIGGGPSGISAAIYSARKGLHTALLAERIGGQVQDTKGIENLISVVYTEGPILASQLRKHIEAYPIKLLEQRRVIKVQPSPSTNKKHLILLEGGEWLNAQQIIVATGAQWRKLGIPGEQEYIGRGVAFCPHCDGPFYKGKRLAVIGGGNSGVEAAIDLAGIALEVTLFEFLDQLKADQVLLQRLQSLPNVKIITSAKTQKVIGDGQRVVGIEYEDRKTSQSKILNLDGVFVQIGLMPNSSFVKDILELSKNGEIITDVKGHTSVKGIYAAGDVTNIPYKQIIISMGEGAKVALAAFEDRIHSST